MARVSLSACREAESLPAGVSKSSTENNHEALYCLRRGGIFGMADAAACQYPNAPSPTVQHPPRSEGQYNHGEFGVYGDYFRLTPRGATGSTNYLGLGGRIGFNVHPNIALEAEMNYDFERNYTTVNASGSSAGGSTTTETSRLRPLTGLFGPKFQFGTSGPF